MNLPKPLLPKKKKKIKKLLEDYPLEEGGTHPIHEEYVQEKPVKQA